MSLQSFLPIPAVAAGDYDTSVASTIGRNEPGIIPFARGEIACGACAGTGLHAHFLAKGCSVCLGTGIALHTVDDPELWVLPPLEPSASWLVVFGWLAMSALSSLFWAGITWAIVAWCT